VSTPETTPILDMVAIVGDYLRSQESVSALVGDRVSHKSPERFDDAKGWVRINKIDATNETGTKEVEHLVSYYLQLDFYAGKANRYAEVADLAIAARAALVVLPKVTLDEAVVTAVGFLSMPADTDPDVGREREILDVEIYAHRR
jgi:hypothetical protein